MAEVRIKNHAMLFAFLVRQTLNHCGEAGKAAVQQGVIHYGEQRGRRMAQRAQQDGMPLDTASYLLYGEWQAAPGETNSQVTYQPRVEMVSPICPWFQTWRDAGMLAEGAYYSHDVDAALARGFGGLDMRLDSNLTLGDATCHFHFEGAGIDAEKQEEMHQHAARLGKRAKMDWAYHTAHLLAAMRGVIIAACGKDGETAVHAALADYAAMFGAEERDRLLRDAAADFDKLPPYEGVINS